MARLILDTGVLIAAARNTIDLAELPDEDDPALPAIAVAEYLAGVHLDPDTDRQTTQRRFLDDILATVPVEDYTPTVAEQHAELLAHTRRTGEPRGPHDLIIAATARTTDRILVTTDERARFDQLPNVHARLLK